MNKSKFLKRSLAAILAILMVVAMVPSAFAATTEPDIIKVQGVAASVDGGKYTVSIDAPNGTATVIEKVLNNVKFELQGRNGTKVGIIGKNGLQIGESLQGFPGDSTASKTLSLLTYATKPASGYWGDYTGMKLKVAPKTGDAATYDLVITVKERRASNDTTIKSINSTRIVKADIDNAAKTVTITKPVGVGNGRNLLGLTDTKCVVTNGAGASVAYDTSTSSDQISSITITAEDGSTQVYDVKYVVEKIFDKFEVPGMIEYKEVESGATGNVNITVKVPYGTFAASKKIIPTFTTASAVRTIQAHDFSAQDTAVDLFDRINGKTTSGVAEWEDTDGTIGPNNQVCSLQVITDVSTFFQDAALSAANVTVTFVPVKNPEAKISDVGVTTKLGSGPPIRNYKQATILVDGTSSTVIVGDAKDSALADTNNENASEDVIKDSNRDIKLTVSTNATVKWMNPYDGWDTAGSGGNNGTMTTTTASNVTTVEIKNIDLRHYYRSSMILRVTSEDKASTVDYALTFRGMMKDDGTPSAIPTITNFELYDNNGVYAPDKDGNITVPFSYSGQAFTGLKYRFTVSNGATVYKATLAGGPNPTVSHNSTVLQSGGDVASLVQVGPPGSPTVPAANGTAVEVGIHVAYESDKTSSCACNNLSKATYKIKAAAANKNAHISTLTLTNRNKLLDTSPNSNKFEATIDHDKKTIRIEVPFNYKPTANTSADGTMYVYDWSVVGANVSENSSNTTTAKPSDFKLARDVLNAQSNKKKLVTLDDNSVTTVAGEKTFDYETNGKAVYVWSENAGSPTANNITSTYYVYAVRKDANTEAVLNSITPSDPQVSVGLDPTVSNLNRFIITVPENYNSKNGVNEAKEFELTFNRSEKSTVTNDSALWLGSDDKAVAFKVVDGKLYYKNTPVAVTDGRIIHVTVTAENGKRTGEYELKVEVGEASHDATLSSVTLDATTSFTKNGNNFVVANLDGDENYDASKLKVIFTTSDPGATVTVNGKVYNYDVATGSNITVDLSNGKTVKALVTAADGVTTQEYTLSMGKPASESDKYTDLPSDAGMRGWAEKAINYGIMSNTGTAADGKLLFSPSAKVPRKDFAVMVARADVMAKDGTITDKTAADAKLKSLYSGTPAFSDAPADNDTVNAALEYCKKNNIISGNPDGTFKPNNYISRTEAASIMVGWLKLPEGNTENTNNFKDWAAIGWAQSKVNSVFENEYMSGIGGGSFGTGTLTREQTAVILTRAYERTKGIDK